MQPPTAPAGLDRRTLYEEILIVLSLSLLASAAYAIISLLSAPLKGGYVASANQTNVLARQLVAIAFSLAPVWLVVHLLRRSGEGVGAIGLTWDQPARDIKRGLAFFAVVGLGGLAFYFGAVALGVNRFVVPVPPLGHWWTVPILVLNAAQTALLEEVIVLGYGLNGENVARVLIHTRIDDDCVRIVGAPRNEVVSRKQHRSEHDEM